MAAPEHVRKIPQTIGLTARQLWHLNDASELTGRSAPELIREQLDKMCLERERGGRHYPGPNGQAQPPAAPGAPKPTVARVG